MLITRSDGLQTRKTGKFADIKNGIPGDRKTKYLWTIDNRGVNLALELSEGRELKHTNLSEKAFIGGEAWIDGDTVYLNGGSGRFGDKNPVVTRQVYAGAVEYWKELGYDVKAMPFGQRHDREH